jgi:hypothetical protein
MRLRTGKWPPTAGEVLAALKTAARQPSKFKRSRRLKRVAAYGERTLRELFASIPHKKLEFIDLLQRFWEMLRGRDMRDPVPNLSTLRRLVREGLREPRPAGRPAKKGIFLRAKKLRAQGQSWTHIAHKLTPTEYANGPRKAAEAIRKGVERLTRPKHQA